VLIPRASNRDTRIASNESVHRSMNERRESEMIDDETVMRCECECFRVECGNDFRVSIEAYERVRADGRRFIVSPGHESDEEAIVLTTPEYLVIEKLGEQGRIAEALDPRSVEAHGRPQLAVTK
jgi:hypothetical protein